MAIKEHQLLTRLEFNEALIKLRLSISEVSKETKIPRTYMSEFRNGDRQLRPEMLSKLRDFFESKGLEFEEDAIATPLNALDTHQTQPSSIAPVAAVPYRFIPVYLEADQPAVIKTQNAIQNNDARIAVLLQQTATHESKIFGSEEFSEDTQNDLHEVYSLMAANYALWRSLSGWPALGLSASNDGAQTIRDVVFHSFADEFAKVGLITQEVAEPADQEENEEA